MDGIFEFLDDKFIASAAKNKTDIVTNEFGRLVKGRKEERWSAASGEKLESRLKKLARS